MLQCSTREDVMPATTTARSRTHPRESSNVATLLGNWAKQGVDSFLATQRILLDLAIRQNASVMHLLREQLATPRFTPARVFGELTGEGVNSFIEAQKVLLDLAHQQNKIVMTGVKERVGDSATAGALTDLLRRSLDNFIEMQQEFLKIAGRQTHNWLQAAKSGKPMQTGQWVEMAREATENFIRAQKRFLDVVAEETRKATGGKGGERAGKEIKKTELSALARQAVESFIEAERKLFDVAGRQVKVNVEAAGKAAQVLRPFPIPLAELTREGVKSYVEASRALMDVMTKRREEARPAVRKPHRVKKTVSRRKPQVAKAAAAAA